MRRCIKLAAQLYPRGWRARYGEEFDALLEDVGAGPREFVDVMRGAVKMQLTRGSDWKIVAAMAVAGAIAAAAVSFRVPERYVSAAVVRVTPPRDAQHGVAVDTGPVLQEVLSRGSLSELIQRPSLNLYPEDRHRIPMEEVIERMRNRDIQVQWSGTDMRISFAYPVRAKAQAVTRALMTRFTEQERVMSRFRTEMWRRIWPQSAVPPAGTVEVLDPASLPAQPIGPNRLAFLAAGLCAGLILGLLTAVTMRRPKWTLRMAGFAAAGCVLGIAVSFLLPDTYTSTAVLRIRPPIVPETPEGGSAAASLAERLQPMQQEILSRGSLAEIIQRPEFDLYRKQRAKSPLEDVVATMRNHLAIRPLSAPNGAAGASAFQISFSYPDALKAQAVVREFVTQFFKQNIIAAQARTKDLKDDDPIRRIEERRLGSNLEVLDPASLPANPVAPNRMAVTAAGIAIGLMLGGLTLLVRRPREPERSLA